MRAAFRKFAERVALAAGTPWAFIVALAFIGGWAAAGPIFGFSQQWQLVVNSVTTVVTFLMVFIIQNTQERDFKSMQLKLDALLRACESPRGLISLQDLPDEDLHRLEEAVRNLKGQPDIPKIVRWLAEKPATDSGGCSGA